MRACVACDWSVIEGPADVGPRLPHTRPRHPHLQIAEEAIRELGRKNILLVASAGNSYASSDVSPNYPAK